MLIQQIIAIILILVIFSRIILRFKRKEISPNEFIIWAVFWILSLSAIIFLKRIDSVVKSIGIVSRGIDIIVYVAVALIFYLIFRIYVRFDKMERDITKVVRKVALDEEKNKSHEA